MEGVLGGGEGPRVDTQRAKEACVGCVSPRERSAALLCIPHGFQAGWPQLFPTASIPCNLCDSRPQPGSISAQPPFCG